VLGDRIGVMRDGKLLQMGSPDEIYNRPADLFVANFTGATNEIAGTLIERNGTSGLADVGSGQRVEVALLQSIAAGEKIYASKCSNCHGKGGHGTGIVPSLVKGQAQKAKAGELFWFITQGDEDNGMPSWASLSDTQRWQVVTYIKSLGAPDKSRAKGKQ